MLHRTVKVAPFDGNHWWYSAYSENCKCTILTTFFAETNVGGKLLDENLFHPCYKPFSE